MATPARTGRARPVSRAPVVVVVAFFAVALTLVVVGAQRSLERRSPPPIGSPGSPDSPRRVTVIMRDYLFEPDPVVLVPGETVELAVFDAGLEPHELVLGDATVQAAWAAAHAAASQAPFGPEPSLAVSPSVGGSRLLVPSGEGRSTIYTVPSTGELLLQCHLPGHLGKGMVGRVELFRTDDPPSTSR